ncbi:tellurite resistance/C4-dicarboxylate transporter family protein [Streptomyces sp. NPDC056835]|uniref:tellurite resistance/C4-dicarboxylate transporter family protein n=1 Tax=Streptomyces sp. NPDC056835 TaxID=3345956 RepID=UPI0036ADA6D8
MKELTPAAGTAVMATGVLSVGLDLTGYRALAAVALIFAGALWVAFAATFTVRLVCSTERWRRDAVTPPALTAVASTCVLSVCLSLEGWRFAAVAALALSAALWPVLLVPVIHGWGRRLPGVVFLVCAATQSLAVGASTLAVLERSRWLCWASLVLFGLGVALYGLALAHFDRREVRTGAGDHWVAGGALSISALAAAKLTDASDPRGPLGWVPALHGPLRTVTLVLLAGSLAWVPVLVYAEARWPRARYNVQRWATVFPLGMTAVACLVVAATAGLPAAGTLGRVLLWIAVALWLLTAVGAARQGRGRPGGRARPPR